MTIVRFGAALTALILSAHAVVAQQPGPGHMSGRRPGEMMGAQSMRQHIQMMESLNTRLDSLVARMNQATGNKKVAAMAAVINELVDQRKMMQQHMRQMMESRSGMMERAGGQTRLPDTTLDSASADTGHARQHPQD